MYILSATDAAHVEEAVRVIRHGGIVAHATETCYGFACDLTNEAAVQKLFTLKKRPADQPVSALFSAVEEAKNCVEWNEQAEELAKKYLPGPLTIVLPLRRKDVHYDRTFYRTIFPSPRSGSTLGIRVSSHPVAQQLSALCGVPLSTTSANLHGEPAPYSIKEILKQFSGQELQPDLTLDGGILPHTPPSTIVDVTSGSVRILRQGAQKL